MDRDEFYLKVAHALSGCQLVEQQLKLYISEALELAKKCIGKRMAFKITGEDYEDSSLERLIDIFRKLSDNEQLVADLRRFKNERNFLSHKGIAHCLDYEGDLFFSTAAEYEARLAAIQVEAERLRRALHAEGSMVRVELDFDFMPDEMDPSSSAA
jgi:hypothetical protein